jgi:cytosine/adenosine deaminase-related metal-dependent hydrolase
VGADLGTLEVGKLADLVVVDGNPLVNIADTLLVRTVIKDGDVFTVEQLPDVPGARLAARTDALPARSAR